VVTSRYQPIFQNFPKTIQNLIKEAVKDMNPKEVILFGSRARGNHRENSDFDFCFKEADPDPLVRAKFKLRVEEEPLTLYKVDLVFFEELSEDYIRNIAVEGKLIYVS